MDRESTIIPEEFSHIEEDVSDLDQEFFEKLKDQYKDNFIKKFPGFAKPQESEETEAREFLKYFRLAKGIRKRRAQGSWEKFLVNDVTLPNLRDFARRRYEGLIEESGQNDVSHVDLAENILKRSRWLRIGTTVYHAIELDSQTHLAPKNKSNNIL